MKPILSADFLINKRCKECHWPVIACTVNWDNHFKDSDRWDFWHYCANKTCKNHDGEGVFQIEPEWVE